MALLSFRGISTPSLPAQGEQRRSSYFNIPRGNSGTAVKATKNGKEVSIVVDSSGQVKERQ
jgi:hypothetical protein